VGTLTEFPFTNTFPPVCKLAFCRICVEENGIALVKLGFVKVQNPGSCRNVNPTNHGAVVEDVLNQ
jgi:hypothetical protein